MSYEVSYGRSISTAGFAFPYFLLYTEHLQRLLALWIEDRI